MISLIFAVLLPRCDRRLIGLIRAAVDHGLIQENFLNALNIRAALAPMLALTAWVAAPCYAAPLLFTGQVQSILLQPSGVGDCLAPCPASTGPDKDGRINVCSDNGGGCETAVVKVIEVHSGAADTPLLTFRSRTGEWGKLNLPNAPAQILIYAENGQTSWAPLKQHDGHWYFKADVMSGPIWPKLKSLEKNDKGEARLDDLVAELR